MNPDLYERYIAKKAKKLGISVEEFKARNSSAQTTEEPKVEYVQKTIQEQIEETNKSSISITILLNG